MCGIIKNKIKGKGFNIFFENLKDFVKNEWESKSNQTIKKTVIGMSNALKRMTELEGAH